jgi:hypothetical protein
MTLTGFKVNTYPPVPFFFSISSLQHRITALRPANPP